MQDLTDYDLDITFIEQDTPIAALMSRTSDNCGSTNASACVTCIAD